MKITAIFVTSADGRTTKGDSTSTTIWNSEEDRKLFHDALENASLIVMGRNTYDAAKGQMEHREGRLRLVVTHHPEQDQVIPGQLEFSELKPVALVHDLEKRGFTEMLLIGGAKLFTEFLAAGLVDELHLTIEPKLFGNGNPLVSDDASLNTALMLDSVEKLNEKGTLYLVYIVVK